MDSSTHGLGRTIHPGAFVTALGLLSVMDCCPSGLAPPSECPDSTQVGDEVTLTTHHVDDGLRWSWQSDDGGGGAFILDGADRDEFTDIATTTGVHEIVFHADQAGTVTITAEEVLLGAPFCIPPPMSAVSCAVTIVDAR